VNKNDQTINQDQSIKQTRMMMEQTNKDQETSLKVRKQERKNERKDK
jgi:hypothetical protein